MHEDTDRAFNQEFGERVRDARETNGWSQRRLAEALEAVGIKLDPSAVTRIERGTRDVKFREAVALASVLSVPLDDLAPSREDPYKEFEMHLASAGKKQDAARSNLTAMTASYLMAIHILQEHPEVLDDLTEDVLGASEVVDVATFLDAVAIALNDSNKPIMNVNVSPEHYDRLVAVINASVTNLIGRLSDEDLERIRRDSDT